MKARRLAPALVLLIGLIAMACDSVGQVEDAREMLPAPRYVVVDTGQHTCYDDLTEVVCPQADEAFYGQDAQYQGNEPAFRDANMANGGGAVYIAFGEALGFMQPPFGGSYTLMDVHGAGAQRSDPKSGDPSDWPYGLGPQGDVIRIYNYVRLMRDAG